MARRERGYLGAFVAAATLRRWSRIARRAETADLSDLQRQRARARALKARLDDVVAIADSRLALPRIGSSAFPRQPGTDWSWRPRLWRGPWGLRGMAAAASGTAIGDGATLFHDCSTSELALRQLRNRREGDLAPFALKMEVFRFDGSFLSLVLELPPAASEGLKRRHLLRVEMSVEVERSLKIFLRLNVKHGPNVEQLVRELPLGQEETFVEFDLAYTRLNEKRTERMWLDLIFDGPDMNQIVLRDVTFARYPRAQL
ncbi:DUF6478 family protein [Wenxinia marina]|uniref:Uncharacterized protein n=1 Tax=Wenxinia marina DSM 24838 TaxID=1123501 RepID=A0A0D0Q7A0_9RHOB|nr:DUF6478 family protein [Wenxinia marina]KIQ70304.1 hypothetical protein Wenmar_00679 [Wenxinia marina DSM 24838]GGL54156.1 hypothetical protein GCM10011392_05720 [Wenxinia marina]